MRYLKVVPYALWKVLLVFLFTGAALVGAIIGTTQDLARWWEQQKYQ